jgi:hypothetical protein
LVRGVADTLADMLADLVLADISPLGLAAGRAAGIPTVLIENFTWDWIYQRYPGAPSELERLGRLMTEHFDGADLRIQTEPACRPIPGAQAVPPVARSPRLERAAVRQALGVPQQDPMILVSMGGVGWDGGPMLSTTFGDQPWVVVPGGTDGPPRRRGRLLQLPFHSEFFHPDLVAASDVVVGKLGYSTVAEAFTSGTALAWIGRPRFPESPVLGRWVTENMTSAEMGEDAFDTGSWLDTVNDLLADPRPRKPTTSGAAQAAEAIVQRFPAVFE